MEDVVDKAHLLKAIEELNECSAAAARCLMQGIDEREPVAGKLNRQWLQDEIADVYATLSLLEDRFSLSLPEIRERAKKKREHLHGWHEQIK